MSAIVKMKPCGHSAISVGIKPYHGLSPNDTHTYLLISTRGANEF